MIENFCIFCVLDNETKCPYGTCVQNNCSRYVRKYNLDKPIPINTLSDVQKKISDNYDAMKDLQLDKNKKYGNAGLEPLGIFFQKKHFEDDMKKAGICCRLDDKLMRVKNSDELRINDVCDLMGYLNLLLISMGATKKDIEKLKD